MYDIVKLTKLFKSFFNIKEKHDFDLDNVVYDKIESHAFTGYKCKKCGKILWLDYFQIVSLPKSMRYCDNK